MGSHRHRHRQRHLHRFLAAAGERILSYRPASVIRLLLIALLLPLQAGSTIDVSPDGKGDHATLQAAINAIPADRKTSYSIRLGPGTYREKIHIPADKPP